jgi:hypothetical protein
LFAANFAAPVLVGKVGIEEKKKESNGRNK